MLLERRAADPRLSLVIGSARRHLKDFRSRPISPEIVRDADLVLAMENRQAKEIREQIEQETSIERRYRELFVSATDVILTHDLDGRVTSFNPAGERVLGWRTEEIIGCPIESLMAPGESNVAGGLISPGGESAMPGGPSFRLEMLARDGRVFAGRPYLNAADKAWVLSRAVARRGTGLFSRF